MRTLQNRLLLLLAASVVASACGGSTRTEAPGTPVDGGGGGGEGGSKEAGGGGKQDSGISPPCEGLCHTVPGTLTVKNATTGALICDATVVSGAATLYALACDAGGDCCEYSVGATSVGATGFTLGAPGYEPTNTSVDVGECCGGCGPCDTPMSSTVSLTPSAMLPPDASAPPAPCPSSEPKQGDPCATLGLYCEYGASSNPSCDDVLQCDASGWDLVSHGVKCPTGTNGCPSSYAAAGGTKCHTAEERQMCDYPQGTCICSDAPDGLPLENGPQWGCTAVAPGCPAAPPPLGTACPASSPSDCDYNQCGGGVGVTCVDGYWAPASVACPA